MIDVLEFFNKNLFNRLDYPYFIKSSLLRKISWRIFNIFSFKKKELNSREFLNSFLPSRFRSSAVERKILNILYKKFDYILSENKFYEEGKYVLFDFPIFPPPEKNLLNSWLIFFIEFFQIIIQDQYWAQKFLKEDSVVIDAGANIGLFSILAARIISKGEVFAFEPASRTFKILQDNTIYYKNIKTFQLALGEKQDIKELLYYEQLGLSAINDSMVPRLSENITGNEKVKIETIDNFVHNSNCKKVDFIKIDTEGYEKNIIKGAVNTIKQFKPVISVSAYHCPGDKKDIVKLLNQIDNSYQHKLLKRLEHVLVFYPRK